MKIVEWLYDEYGVDFILTPNGAVAMPNGEYTSILIGETKEVR